MSEVARLKEINQRVLDGLTVTLWWVEKTLDTLVTVDDTKGGSCSHWEIPVVPPVTPNEVFMHPFSYLPELTEPIEPLTEGGSQ